MLGSHFCGQGAFRTGVGTVKKQDFDISVVHKESNASGDSAGVLLLRWGRSSAGRFSPFLPIFFQCFVQMYFLSDVIAL